MKKFFKKILEHEKDIRNKLYKLFSNKNIIMALVAIFCFTCSIYLFSLIIFQQKIIFKAQILPILLFFIYLFVAPKVSKNLYNYIELRKKLKIIENVKNELFKAQIYKNLSNKLD